MLAHMANTAISMPPQTGFNGGSMDNCTLWAPTGFHPALLTLHGTLASLLTEPSAKAAWQEAQQGCPNVPVPRHSFYNALRAVELQVTRLQATTSDPVT
eukprot:NODE_10715_length_1334_cov_2.052196.p3 GENE.NODE_10715_length_1334_cov_2.052196~~NODE_10715_length_1334_cov_2.052196.p3  ORF type:complete len:99 (+),score=9.41 NODE_10715_length_1334_cov_2.052196:895-1191(+)